MKLAKFLNLLLKYIFLIAVAFSIIYPLIWIVLGSLKSQEQFFNNPWGVPSQLDWDVYRAIFVDFKLHLNVLNSVYIASTATVLVVLFSAMVAYGLVRMKWRGSKLVMGIILLGIMIPVHSTLIPVYIELQGLAKIIDARVLLLIPYIAFGIPTSVMILSGYFSTISRELEEASIVDGGTIIGTFFRIILPISLPAIATTAILSFINSWNELLYALIFLQKSTMQTIPVALLQFMGFYSTNWSQVLASITVATLPGVVIYMFLQNYIIQGMTAGAVKE